MFKLIILFITIMLGEIASAEINLTALNNNGFAEWEPKSFSGETSYEVTKKDGRAAIKAISEKTASGYAIKKKIDLAETPYINWTWFIETALPKLDEQSKAGDDYAARIYVVIDGGFFIWNTKALNYVWSSSQAEGQAWDNAFVGSNAKMLAVRGKDSKIDQWYNEKRNVYEDLIQYFGDKGSNNANQEAYRYIDVVAIMTDTDNSQGYSEAYYGDIIFSAE